MPLETGRCGGLIQVTPIDDDYGMWVRCTDVKRMRKADNGEDTVLILDDGPLIVKESMKTLACRISSAG